MWASQVKKQIHAVEMKVQTSRLAQGSRVATKGMTSRKMDGRIR